MERTCHWHRVLTLVCVNLAVRGLWLALMHPPQQSDFLWYYTHAVQIAEGKGYVWGGHPTAYWPIGYSFFLSILFRFTGPSVTAGLIANALLSTGIVVLVYALAYRLVQRSAVAVAAAWAYTILPSAIEWNAVLGSEELFTFLLMAALFTYAGALPSGSRARILSRSANPAAVQAASRACARNVSSEGRATLRGQNLTRVFIAGILLGFACDVRPIPLLFPVAVLAYEWGVARRGPRAALGRAVLLALGMAWAIAPVTVRNLLVMHHFVLISTNGGVNLWQGTHADGAYFWSWDRRVNPLLAAGSDEVLENQIGVHAFLAYALHHPLRLVLHALAKWFYLYWVDWNVVDVTFATWWQPHTAPLIQSRAINTGAYWLWMSVAVAGAVAWGQALRRRARCCRARWARATWPMLYIVYNTAVFAVFPAWDRFRFPMMPLFAIYAGVGWWLGVCPALRRWRRSRT
jgi:hypothetical protein